MSSTENQARFWAISPIMLIFACVFILSSSCGTSPDPESGYYLIKSVADPNWCMISREWDSLNAVMGVGNCNNTRDLDKILRLILGELGHRILSNSTFKGQPRPPPRVSCFESPKHIGGPGYIYLAIVCNSTSEEQHFKFLQVSDDVWQIKNEHWDACPSAIFSGHLQPESRFCNQTDPSQLWTLHRMS